VRPPMGESLFLSQKPYMTIGSLRYARHLLPLLLPLMDATSPKFICMDAMLPPPNSKTPRGPLNGITNLLPKTSRSLIPDQQRTRLDPANCRHRDNCVYPSNGKGISNDDVMRALEAVNMGNAAER
jgi:hypothetical protein